MGKPITPWTYSVNSDSEHAEQVRLMLWRTMAVRAGFDAAFYEGAYALNEAGLFAAYPNGGVRALKLLHAIPNGGERDRRVASRLKAEGVKAGVCDLSLPIARLVVASAAGGASLPVVPCARQSSELGRVRVDSLRGYCGLYIELKRLATKTQRKGTVQDNQTEFQREVIAQGYAAVTAYGWLEAAYYIANYIVSGRLTA